MANRIVFTVIQCVLERFEDNVTLQDWLILADGESISISFLLHQTLPIEFSETTEHPIKLMLDTKTIIGIDMTSDAASALKRVRPSVFLAPSLFRDLPCAYQHARADWLS
jgi:hypothetical protein